MADFDPRADTGIPTEQVGSLPRPSSLQAAYAAYDAGEIDRAALAAEQEAAVRDSIERMEATGSPIISDGEQRWSSFATYPGAPGWPTTWPRPAGSSSPSSPTGTTAGCRG